VFFVWGWLGDSRWTRTRPRRILPGELPSPLAPPSGCAFHTRCPMVQERCRHEAPMLRRFGDDAEAACHFADG
jgi:oligopeptide/dipeptide ABC transporter ATP-binding protein